MFFFFSSRRRHTRCALVTGVQTGAIPIYTPTMDATASYGRFNNFAAKAFISAPLIDDKLAFSVSGAYEDMDGWNDDLVNGGHIGKVQSRLIRAKVLFEPAENVKFTLGGQYSHRQDRKSVV